MGKAAYIGVSSKARKVKKAYIGVGGKARKIKKMYIGDANGKARLFWSGGGDKFFFAHSFLDGTISCSSFGNTSANDLVSSSFSGNYKPLYSCCVDGVYYAFVGTTYTVSGVQYYSFCGYFYTSDLSQWTYSALPSTLYTSDNNRKTHGIKYMNGRFVAMVSVKNSWKYDLYAYESVDAITWTQKGQVGTQIYDAFIREMQYGNVVGSKGYYVAIDSGSSNSSSLYSRDLITWTVINSNSRTLYGSCVDQNEDVIILFFEAGTGSNNLHYTNLNITYENGIPIDNNLWCGWSDSTRPVGGIIPVGSSGLVYVGHTSQSYTYKFIRIRDAAADTVMSSFNGFIVSGVYIVLVKGTYFFVYASSLTGQGGSPKNVNIGCSNDLVSWVNKQFTDKGVKACTPVAFEENE